MQSTAISAVVLSALALFVFIFHKHFRQFPAQMCIRDSPIAQSFLDKREAYDLDHQQNEGW